MSDVRSQVIDFCNEGFEKVSPNRQRTKRPHELANRNDNFRVSPPKGFKFHRHAACVNSSQAFACNLFAKFPVVEFELGLWAIDRNAEIDAAVSRGNIVELYEIKFSEPIRLRSIKFDEKYDNPKNYRSKEYAPRFIDFIEQVI
jgi:hypothetical protein